LTDHLTTTLTDRRADKVTLTVPCLAAYVGVARLATLGVANRISFTYDEVEDVRLAVGEACTHSVERASEYFGRSLQDGETQPAPTALTITCIVDGSTLTIEVADQIPASEHDNSDNATGLDGIDYQKLGTVLMEILVDEVTIDATSSGTTVKLIKTASQVG
jgi:serine/threonine-protein kinase RsbW